MFKTKVTYFFTNCLIYGFSAVSVSFASPNIQLVPNNENKDLGFSIPCSPGAQFEERLGSLLNSGDQELKISEASIVGKDAESVSLSISRESEDLSIEAGSSSNISLECSPLRIQNSPQDLLDIKLRIVSNDPLNPVMEYPITARLENRPNLQVLYPGTTGKIVSTKNHQKDLMMWVVVQNNGAVSASSALPFSVRVILRKAPGTYVFPDSDVFAKLSNRVTKEIAPGESVRLRYRIKSIPTALRKFKFGTPIPTPKMMSGSIEIDPGRKILEGNEDQNGKTFDLGFSDNTASFAVK